MKIKEEKRKEQDIKGITLIALVVTIVVLLILAGVAISMLSGDNGILNKAVQAKDATRGGEVQEIVTLAAANNTGVDYIGGTKQTRAEVITQLHADGKLTDSEVATLEENDVITIGGIEIDFSNLDVEIDTKILADLKVGDYVIYNSGDNDELMFRVLYEQNSEYGLQIISNQSLENVELGSSDIFAEEEGVALIDKLKEVAEKYLNTLYANDARCIGTHPLNGADYEFNTETYKIDLEQIVNNNMSIADNNYWISSMIKETPWTTTYCVISVTTEGNEEKVTLCAVTPYGTFAYSTEETRGFRTCITLKETLKVLSGDGKSEKTAYKLGI